jgi:putative peptidoglycan lipid II flippase
VIRATLGIWVNYTTTVAFQIAFAFRYGSGMEASVFVVVFGLVIALGGVVTASVQSVVVPRLLTPSGRLRRAAVKVIGVFTVIAVAALTVLWLEADGMARLLAAHTQIPRASLYDAVRAAVPFVLLQLVAGELMAINLAIGRRFAPAVAPAIPSVAGVIALVVAAQLSVPALFAILSVGAFVEVVLLAVALALGLKSKWRPVSGRLPRVGLIAAATTGQLILLSLLPAFERVMASAHSPSGAADYNYAIRSLLVVQQLLIGGCLLSSLGDWSKLANSANDRAFRRSLVSTVTAAGVLLTLAASVALVAAPYLVQVVYGHGAFTTADATSVARLIRFALPGFVAEGVGLIFSQGFLAYRRNGVAISIGLVYFLVRAGLALGLGIRWGAVGVAVAYSVSTVIVVSVEAVALVVFTVVRRRDFVLASKGVAVAAGTLLTATACMVFAHAVPSSAQACLVVGAFLLLLRALRPLVPGTVRHAH